jgi:hypothetical protein
MEAASKLPPLSLWITPCALRGDFFFEICDSNPNLSYPSQFKNGENARHGYFDYLPDD